ncbi:DUF2894 domain-containing protein [Bordetella bronchiseptica]
MHQRQQGAARAVGHPRRGRAVRQPQRQPQEPRAGHHPEGTRDMSLIYDALRNGPSATGPGAPVGRGFAGAPARPADPELPLLDEFRQAWTRLSTDRQLRQSEQLVPENAGPLNSSHLAHRSLALMQGLSPGYLQQFLSYVDALGWLEQLTANAAPAARDTARATPRKTARARSR